MRVGTLLKSAAVMALAIAAPALADGPAGRPAADPLADGFRDPPQSARPRVWWHWLNGNVTEDGIAKDLAWMHRIGIGGLQAFDANLLTPQVVDRRLAYMTPEWKRAFRFAASEADRLGLEMAIAASPGWSETGGPWVKPQDGLKKLVWSETLVTGGKRFTGRLAAPPSITGPFQSLPMAPSIEEAMGAAKPTAKPSHYADVAVLAYPVTPATDAAATVRVGDRAVDGAALADDDLASALEVAPGTAEAPGSVTLAYPQARTIRTATVFIPGGKQMFTPATVRPRLQASDDGAAWRDIADFEVTEVPTTVAFAPVSARHFRLLLNPAGGAGANMGEPAPGVAAPALFGGGGAPAPVRVGTFRLSAEPRVDRAEAKAGFSIARDYYGLTTSADPGEAGAPVGSVVDLTGRMRADGSLDWTPPSGRWRVVRLGWSLLGTTNHPASPEATGLEVDKFDGAAVRAYLDHYLGLYRDAAGADFIGARGVRALLTDSIEVGAANWTPRMVDQFKRLRGYDPTPWLPALTGALIGTRAETDRFLYDYRRTLADLMASEHYGTVAAVAHANGLAVYGEALEDNRPSLGDDMAMRAHADVPMAAMWTFGRANGPNPSYLADIKGAASVAHLYGQNIVAAESMTSAMAPWAFAPSDLKRVVDLEFVTGVNRPVIHTSVHQPLDDKVPGLSLAIFGQYFNRHETWAEMAKPWVDYMARTGFLLQQGVNVADVAYFYGEEAPLTGLYGGAPVADAPRAYAYDFVNPDVVRNLLSVDGGGDLVARSGARYRLLYLGGSSSRMTLPMLRRVADLADAGATIVGAAPTGSPSLTDDAADYRRLVGRLWGGGAETIVSKGRVIAGPVEAALTRIGAMPDVAFSGTLADSDLPFVHRKLADGDAYFIVNRRNRPERVEAHFRVAGRAPELWHADTGVAEPASFRSDAAGTTVPLELGPEESVFVLFRKPAGASPPPARALAPAATLGGAWTVSFQPGRGAPAATTLATLAPLSVQADPGVRYFSGVATYTRSFDAPRGWRAGAPLWLDLGQVGDLAEVRVNGQSVGTAWHAPYRIDIAKAARRGRNRLEVQVANLWVNRLIGDAQPGAKSITWTSMPTYRADAPLRPSGLIGPVTLLTAR